MTYIYQKAPQSSEILSIGWLPQASPFAKADRTTNGAVVCWAFAGATFRMSQQIRLYMTLSTLYGYRAMKYLQEFPSDIQVQVGVVMYQTPPNNWAACFFGNERAMKEKELEKERGSRELIMY